MRKPIGLLSGIIPLVFSSVKKRKQYPSRADDAGDPSREAKYLSSIILNKLNAAQEVSDQIAASAVYGYDSYLSSHAFANLYVVDLFKYLKDKGKFVLQYAFCWTQTKAQLPWEYFCNTPLRTI